MCFQTKAKHTAKHKAALITRIQLKSSLCKALWDLLDMVPVYRTKDIKKSHVLKMDCDIVDVTLCTYTKTIFYTEKV